MERGIKEVGADALYSLKIISRILGTEIIISGIVYLYIFLFSSISLFYHPSNSDILVVWSIFFFPSPPPLTFFIIPF